MNEAWFAYSILTGCPVHMKTCSQGLSSFQPLEILKDPWKEVSSEGTFTRSWGKKYHRDALLMRAGGWNYNTT